MPEQDIQIRDVDVHEAQRLGNAGALMLDVRENEEWGRGHLPGATHLPLGDLPASELSRGRLIVAVCRSGNRSAKAARLLATRGHDVVNMAGGMKSWQEAGLPVVTPIGGAGTI